MEQIEIIKKEYESFNLKDELNACKALITLNESIKDKNSVERFLFIKLFEVSFEFFEKNLLTFGKFTKTEVLKKYARFLAFNDIND